MNSTYNCAVMFKNRITSTLYIHLSYSISTILVGYWHTMHDNCIVLYYVHVYSLYLIVRFGVLDVGIVKKFPPELIIVVN